MGNFPPLPDNMKKYFMLSFVIIFSCKESTQQRKVAKIDLDISKEIKMSELFESMEYLLVQEQDSLPIVQPYKVLFNDSLIFIEDNELDNLFIVDRNDGKVKRVLQSFGSGSGEFNQIEDFQIKGNLIIIKDVILGKLISFDFEGNFISEKRVSNEATNFYQGTDFLLLYFNNRSTNYGTNFLTEFNPGEVLKYDSINNIYRDVPAFNLDNGFQWNTNLNQIHLSHPDFYEVHFFDSLGRGINSQLFDFGKYSLEDRIRKDYINGEFLERSKDDQGDYVKGINRFFAVRDMYFMLVTNGKRERHSIFMNFDFKPFIQSKELINDIDGMNHRNTPRFSSSEHLVVMTRSNKLYNDYQAEKDFIQKNYPDEKIHSFIDQITDKLYDDRVAFIFYKLKSKAELEQLD